MDFIPNNPVLKFHTNTLLTLRRNYSLEKNGDMNLVIDSLNDWLNKQEHLLKRNYARDYLERAIIFQKGSIERTKTQIDKICTLRTLIPSFFQEYDPERYCLPTIQYSYVQAFLPNLTADNYRIYLAKMTSDELSSKLIFTIYKLTIMLLEYLKLHDYCDGFILIFDLTEINILDLIKAINIIELQQMAVITLDGYGFRVKGIHIITQSPAVDLLVKLMKQVLSKKMGNRIHVNKQIDSLHKVVDRNLLPKEYGGNEDSLKYLYDSWAQIISTKTYREYMKEMNKACTNESLRQQNNAIMNDYLGITGNFRSLSVD